MTRGAFFLLPFLLLSSPAVAGKGDCVVFLHGIGRTSRSMEKMAAYFSGAGYEVLNIDYASRKKNLSGLAEDIGEEIGARGFGACGKLHFAGYSMGGLVARAYISRYRPKNLGRVVMLGTPNRGSEVADFLSGTFLFDAFYGPAGRELVTDQSAFTDVLGKVSYEVGVIAGDRSIDPVSSLLIIPGKDDGKVSVESTKLEGMKDHIVLHATHTFMAGNDEVIRQAEHFIRHGKFRKDGRAP